MSKHSIDDIIKKALEKIESNPRNADWDSFESVLNGNELTDFDLYLKDKLEKVSPPADGAWNKFEDKHAEELGNEHPVDEVVKDNLKGHEAAFVENSWARLSALLDLTDRRERELLIKKVVEVCTVSLILFLLIPQFFNNRNTIQTEPAQYAQEKQKPQDNRPMQEVEPTTSTSAKKIGSITHAAKNINEALAQNSAGEQFSNGSVLRSERSSTSKEQNVGQATPIHFTALTPLPVKGSNKINHSFIPATDGNIQADHGNFSNEKLPSITPSLLAQNAAFGLPGNQIEQVPFLPLTVVENKTKTEYPQVQLAELEQASHTSLAVVMAPQFTHVYTPKDQVYTDPKLNIQPYGRIELFNSMGLEIEKQHNEFSMGGNISYSKLSYRPPTIVEKYDGSISVVASDTIRNGYRELSLVNLELQMASISLFMRQYFPLGQNMRLFAHLGSGINMVMKSDYLIHNITNKGNGKRVVEEFEFNNDEENAATAHVKLREKNFEGGIMEGGNFNRNSYMDVEFGGGIEYDLNDECSVYIASIMNYSPFSDGLGPNRDKINSLNFQFGVKQSL